MQRFSALTSGVDESNAQDASDGYGTVKLSKKQFWKYKKHLNSQLSNKDKVEVEEIDRLNMLYTVKTMFTC